MSKIRQLKHLKLKITEGNFISNADFQYLFINRIQGQPVFDPTHGQVQKRLYRTNPTIPRPESKHGTRSAVYEKIIELKKQNLDSNGMKKPNI